MKEYAVHKYFGHVWQCWKIYAESEEDAWENAEKKGYLQYQNVYSTPFECKGSVVDIEENTKDSTVTKEQYGAWLREAMDMGMVITPEYYEIAFGTSCAERK